MHLAGSRKTIPENEVEGMFRALREDEERSERKMGRRWTHPK